MPQSKTVDPLYFGILYFPKDDTVVSINGSLILGSTAGTDPKLNDICIVRFGKTSGRKVPWKGILLLKTTGMAFTMLMVVECKTVGRGDANVRFL